MKWTCNEILERETNHSEWYIFLGALIMLWCTFPLNMDERSCRKMSMLKICVYCINQRMCNVHQMNSNETNNQQIKCSIKYATYFKCVIEIQINIRYVHLTSPQPCNVGVDVIAWLLSRLSFYIEFCCYVFFSAILLMWVCLSIAIIFMFYSQALQ